jgi:hypothetical protein
VSSPNQPSNEDLLALRTRFAQLVEGLKSSHQHNPATLDALERIFPHVEGHEPRRQPMLTKLKDWLSSRKAA